MNNEVSATPIHKLGLQFNYNNYYIKRDDLFPLSFGGNKARKAVLFLKDLKEKRADCIVTYGSSSSNHCRIIANIAASIGLPCYIISPSESSHSTFNSKLNRLFGAVVLQCPVANVSSTIDRKLNELKTEGYNPYFIQGGGHGDIGTHAYVQAYKEILEYEQQINQHFDYIFFASGTGTTQAGLICGSLLHDFNRKIVGISIARKIPYGKEVVLDSVNSYMQSIERNFSINEDAVEFIDDYVLKGYDDYNKEILMTIKETLLQEGVPLDRTYTGKAFWGMKEYIKEREIKGKNILFIHTGGTPLFFDKLGDLLNERE